MHRIKLRWAKKLMQAKYFVVLTDKESVIAVDGVNPDSFDDAIALTAQAAELEDFRDKLDGLINKHQKAVDKLRGVNRAKTTAKRKTVKKINVKEG